MSRYYLLYIPGLICLLLPLLYAICTEAKQNAAAREKEAKRAAAAAAKLEAQERRQAEREAMETAKKEAEQNKPKRGRGRPRKNPLPPQRPETIPAADPVPALEEVPASPAADPAPVIHSEEKAARGVIKGNNEREPPCTPEEFISMIA